MVWYVDSPSDSTEVGGVLTDDATDVTHTTCGESLYDSFRSLFKIGIFNLFISVFN